MLRNKGSFTIEACFGILLVMVVMLAVANFISISYERNMISQKVEILAVNASINGGLLKNDLDSFLSELEKKNYNTANIKVSVKRVVNGSTSGDNLLIYNDSLNYVKISDTNNQIQLTVTIPYKENTTFYKLFNDLDEMKFERRFASRRS